MSEIVERLVRMESKLEHIENQNREAASRLEQTDAQLNALVLAEATRRGREEIYSKDADHRHDDRWQVWFRALVPAAVLTAIFNAVIAVFRYGNGGGQ